MGKINCIGILTSGGDAPGMNAAIRAVTRAGIAAGLKVKGIYRGYEGLINNEIQEFTTENVSNIIQRGGTILKTARSKEFLTPEGRKKAYDNMVEQGIDALIIIGGNGSLEGARIFAEEFDVPCIGLPGTIDNDLSGTDSTIGYDTTLNTIVQCVDKIRDTATSHERIFFIEVMGTVHQPGYSQEQEFQYGYRVRKPQVRCHVLCRPGEERISRIRRARVYSRAFAAWRLSECLRPYFGFPFGGRRHYGFARRAA